MWLTRRQQESFTSDTGEGDDEEDEEDEEGEQMQTSPEFKVPGNPVRRASTGGAMDVSPGNAAGQVSWLVVAGQR